MTRVSTLVDRVLQMIEENRGKLHRDLPLHYLPQQISGKPDGEGTLCDKETDKLGIEI